MRTLPGNFKNLHGKAAKIQHRQDFKQGQGILRLQNLSRFQHTGSGLKCGKNIRVSRPSLFWPISKQPRTAVVEKLQESSSSNNDFLKYIILPELLQEYANLVLL